MRKRGPFHLKAVAVTLLATILFQIMEPTVAFALTGGPAQPESAQFQPVGVTDMVDVFTGDFGYNIPLLELPGPNGGYPFNLSYQSGITMDQEASWVGLGWNVNPGAITRNMRGLPDEFNGKSDAVERLVDIKTNETYGAGAGVSAEVFSGDFAVGVSASFKIYDNTYRGIGYGIDLGTSFSENNKTGMNAGIGFNLSLDSQEGVGANVNATLSNTKAQKDAASYGSKQNLSLGIGFHSNGGLNASISGGIGKRKANVDSKGNPRVRGSSINGSSAISFSVPSYTPSIGMEMRSLNFTTHASVGGGTNGAFPYVNVNGFYSRSKVANTTENIPAYGYMHLQDQAEDYAMADFNREKDGVLYSGSKNLASPSLTYDFYVINGQGIGGMFRPYRQDFGHVHEQARTSSGAGGTLGFDVGVPGHYGINGTFNYSRSRTGDWTENNGALDYFRFLGKGFRDGSRDSYKGDLYEGVYFKLAGENAAVPVTEMANILGEKPVKLKNNGHSLTRELVPSPGNGRSLNKSDMRREHRMPRAVSIVPYTNRQIMSVSPGTNMVGNEVLREYDINVYQKVGYNGTINTTSLGASKPYRSLKNARGKGAKGTMEYGEHPAGHTIIQPDGKRYVYALPAYNNKQVQETFSVPPANPIASTISVPFIDTENPQYKHPVITDEFRERVTIPRFAHSYLLTSVLGDDYVDADDIPGPSKGDYGYWVKFNYVQTSEAYQWRAPYNGANYLPGSAGSVTDDKASYTYGTKEIWYLASAETQTHIAVFEMSPRLDGLGAAAQMAPNNRVDNPSKDIANKLYKLDRIKLYSKEELAAEPNGEPMQTVHFSYSYNLCPHTTNSTAPGGGKLTLEKVYFTHKYDRSGALSPYIFEYDTNNNPAYDLAHNKYDRWGTYRSYNYGDDWVNQEYPYTPQLDPDQRQSKANRDAFKAQTDKDASAWHLKSVRLPSGGRMQIEYESDDYAYVQHKKAAQMFRIASVRTSPDQPGNVLFDKADNFWGAGYDADDSRPSRTVYFKLEKPIQSLGAEYVRDQVTAQYMDCLLDKSTGAYTKPLYAKFKVRLRGDINEYISGYFNAELDKDKKPLCGGAGTPVTIDGMSSYEYGYLVLDRIKIDDKPVNYPPLAVAAWQHLRTNLPRVLTGMGTFESGENATDLEHMTRIASLGSWMNTIRTMFTGYRKYCFEKEFGNRLTLRESFIRLSSPDGIKYGGGSRVKKIYVEDDPVWGNDKIGQVYDYTIETRAGKTSSGVAAYEPVIGGEENVLRTAKFQKQSIPFFTDNNLFFELPVNESYYPAPRVGYSKVTVSSLATAEVQEKIAQGAAASTYEGILTTGRTVHEFYTARDFPVIAEETDMQTYGKPTVVPLPFVGMVQVSKLTASQGYSIRLNDMHGKPKSTATYASRKQGGFENDPITQVQYKYRTTPYIYEGENVWVLNSLVDVLQDDPQMAAMANQPAGAYDKALTQKMLVGWEYDFFADFRHSVDEAGTGGLNFNMDIMGGGPVQFPLPFPWPSFNFSHTSTRTAVTNKIISQAGLLDSVVATDGQSTVCTKNLVYDKYTGQPLVTAVNNNYGNQVFNYEYPAHLAYNGTGAAYENILMEFTGFAKYLEGRGWTLAHEDLTGPIPYYAIGNNPGMGVPLMEVSGVNRVITFNQLYDYLNEGDEFIVEFLGRATGVYMPEDKHMAILTEKRTGTGYADCSDDKQLLFDFAYGGPFTWREGTAVRMLLVRSGKRNLLNLKTGAIKTLLDLNASGTLLEKSPLYKREKETSEGTVQPWLYDSLGAQTSRFLNRIIDCNGQYPVGTYYLDHPRFLKNDGSLMFPELFGLLESINVFDNCGQPIHAECLTSVATPKSFRIDCNDCPGKPTGDYYDPPQCHIVNENVDASVRTCILSWANAQVAAGNSPESVVQTWNTSRRYTPMPCGIVSYDLRCARLNYAEGSNCTSSHQHCHDCGGALMKDAQGKNVYKGYHLVLRFRQAFAAQAGDCLTAHCFASAKYKDGSGHLKRTRIEKSEYIGGGKIRFTYAAGGSTEPGDTSRYCMRPYSFKIPATYYTVKNVLSASAVELSPYKINADMYPAKACTANSSEVMRKLYQNGYKGIWRAAKTYYYNDERFQGVKTDPTAHMTSMLDLATDGVYDGNQNPSTGVYDKKFYLFNWNAFLAKKIHPNWLANETVTAFTRNSQSAEARDVLGIYSAVAFDKHGYLPVAVGKNMRLDQMVYENFDNTLVIGWAPGEDLDGNGHEDRNQVEVIPSPFTGGMAMSVKTTTKYIFPRAQFAPVPGKTYIVSMWVGGFNTLRSPEEIDAKFPDIMNVTACFLNAAGQTVGTCTRMRTSGRIYEGKGGFWRKLEYQIQAPYDASTHRLALTFGTSGYSSGPNPQEYGTMYRMLDPNGKIFVDQRSVYDDIRIFPADGLMQTYVYDTRNYRLTAEGDENNFPTLYGYSPSGALMVVKKLTEEGIKTLKEIRANTKRGTAAPSTGPGQGEGQ